MEYQRFNKKINDIDVEFSLLNHPLINIRDCLKDMSEKHSDCLKDGDIVIDIGANHGTYSLIYASKIGSNGRVYSFEASPNIFKQLEENVSRNKKLNITPINKAVTEKKGNYTFHYVDSFVNGGFASETDSGIGACGHSQPVEVEGVNLIEWINENLSEEERARISLVKIDAEGYDLKIIRSIKDILKDSYGDIRPVVQFEFFTAISEKEVVDIISTFNDLRYILLYKKDFSTKLLNLDLLIHQYNYKRVFSTVSGFDCIAYPIEQILTKK